MDTSYKETVPRAATATYQTQDAAVHQIQYELTISNDRLALTSGIINLVQRPL